MFICLLPWFSPQVSTRYHEFRVQSFDETGSRSGLPLLVASVFKAEEDGCYFLCMYMHVSNIFIHCVVHFVKEHNSNRKVN